MKNMQKIYVVILCISGIYNYGADGSTTDLAILREEYLETLSVEQLREQVMKLQQDQKEFIDTTGRQVRHERQHRLTAQARVDQLQGEVAQLRFANQQHHAVQVQQLGDLCKLAAANQQLENQVQALNNHVQALILQLAAKNYQQQTSDERNQQLQLQLQQSQVRVGMQPASDTTAGAMALKEAINQIRALRFQLIDEQKQVAIVKAKNAELLKKIQDMNRHSAGCAIAACAREHGLPETAAEAQ